MLVVTFLGLPFVDVIFAEKVIATIPEAGDPIGLTVNPANNSMYAAIAGADEILVTDSNPHMEVTRIPVGFLTGVNFDSPIELNPFHKYMYVTNSGSNTVSVINSTTNTVTKTIAINPSNPSNTNPQDILYNPLNSLIYTANTGQGTVSVIDGLSLLLQLM